MWMPISSSAPHRRVVTPNADAEACFRDACGSGATMMPSFPSLLEYIPYRRNDYTAERDALRHPYLCEHGFVCVRVDVRGSGDSEGTLSDEVRFPAHNSRTHTHTHTRPRLSTDRSVSRVGADGRRRRHRIPRITAMVQRQSRHVREELGRVQLPAGGRASAARPPRDHRRRRHRRPACGRRPLHRRRLRERQRHARLGQYNAVLRYRAAGSAAVRASVEAGVARAATAEMEW